MSPVKRPLYQITNQANLRRAFWEAHPNVSRKRWRNGDYPADTRVAFVDWLDSLARWHHFRITCTEGHPMKRIIVAGQSWLVISPSLFELDHPEMAPGRNVLIGFNGRSWKIGVDNEYGTLEKPTRDQAMAHVAATMEACTQASGGAA